MDIFNLNCPKCSKEYYGDVSLLSLEVELHCPFCGSYFRKQEVKNLITPGRKGSSIVRLNSDKTFYRPKETKR
jgi:DNA-directed RNA polymerase subunit RPC12/RpoP